MPHEPRRYAADRPRRRYGAPKNWRVTFLAALAETSNVTASAQRADISLSWAYKQRREDTEFARRWIEALCEGYDNLEMDVLHRLRAGALVDAAGHKHDNASAIRLLVMHKADVARARALKDDDDEQAVLESIDAMIDAMRQRGAANAAEIEAGPEADADDR
ncbi:MAG: hypothetical protein EOO76_19820 [Novosphingobium sp.]|nr:MAG: hypothetical protein EOO76_19820 [Novosphingobium sp.]